jgi:response regulator RpfG family c-di-GMP phosphodiesterase
MRAPLGTDPIPQTPPGATVELPPESSSRRLLKDLFDGSLVLAEDWHKLPNAARDQLSACKQPAELFRQLVQAGLLTEYQANRAQAGTLHGMVLGNYRVLDRLGAGGMGVVFKGEHIMMRRPVAIKVLPLYGDQDDRILRRFLAEMRMSAQLRHPNVVTAMDAGQVRGHDANLPTLYYLVMEYVEGKDLENLVRARGPLDPVRAFDLVHQIACALVEAHDRNLVHRDIKPSNILVTPEGRAVLLDFGLAHNHSHGLTDPGSLLGTIEFMAPEQAADATAVDTRADIYSLGATLYWCLTGKVPFPYKGSRSEEMARRLNAPPPSAKSVRPDLPAELDELLGRMMAPLPKDRFANPQMLKKSLARLMRGNPAAGAADLTPAPFAAVRPGAGANRILVVDDEASVRLLCKAAFQGRPWEFDEASDGDEALRKLTLGVYDVAVLDVCMPGATGPEVLRALRELPACRNLRILMLSGRIGADDMSELLHAGADDFLLKPFTVTQLVAKVQAALRLKHALDRSGQLNRELRGVSAELERALQSRDTDLMQVRSALVLGLASLVKQRTTESNHHLIRMQRYSRTLAEAAAATSYASEIDVPFIETLECCSPLHDIGIVSLPDHILMKPGRLAPDERVIMQSHTLIGAEILGEMIANHGSGVQFLRTAVDLARSHHENYDGTGYPDRLSGPAIPLVARLFHIGDVYDALRCRRTYRPALSHNAAVQVMTEACAAEFDPLLLDVFRARAEEFERIYLQFPD